MQVLGRRESLVLLFLSQIPSLLACFACFAPTQIAENAGTEGAVVLERIKDNDFGFGWNAATSSYENLLESGVIDPATVTQQAVLNSASIAASIITTSVRLLDAECMLSPVNDASLPRVATYISHASRCAPPLQALITEVKEQEVEVGMDDGMGGMGGMM